MSHALSIPSPVERASVDVACSHCGLSVPAGLIVPQATEQFCCHGCSTAYAVIRGCGLERYYHVREQAAGAAAPVRSTGKRYGEFDDPLFHSLYVKPHDHGGVQIELFLEGVHCAACVWLIERLPMVQPGVAAVRLEPSRSLVRIVWDPQRTPLSQIARTLDSLGYPPHPAREGNARSMRRLDDRRSLIRLGVAGACAGNVMILALGLYAGAFDSMDDQYRHLFRWGSMLISLVSVLWPGSVFFRGAWAAIRTRTPHLDLPIAIGLGAGAIWGTLNTIRGVGEIYFDSLSVLVFALLVGRLIQHRQRRWSADAVELLFSLTPSSARKVEPAGVIEVPVESITSGDLVEVLAGDSFPADGVVETGESSIDQSLLTGESIPVGVHPGEPVSAGAVNLSSPLRVRVSATGEATRVGRLMKTVEEATRRRAPIVRLADRIAAHFVVVMLALSVITAIAWCFINPAMAIDNAAALLIVTCPCALGLATPLAVTVAVGRAARRGILVKGGDVVQSLAGHGTIFLDKTGTLTQGRMSLMHWTGPDELGSMVLALEALSSHPIAAALVRDLPQFCNLNSAAPRPAPTDVHQVLGGGISGTFGNRRLVVGSASFVRAHASNEDARVHEAEASCIHSGWTPILISLDGRIQAVAGVGDPIREDAKETVASLRSAGWNVRILSGDHPAVVGAVAHTLDVPEAAAQGGASPEDKLHAVTQAARSGTVVMVGDGVNDAAALAAATVGMAVRGGAEASLAAADVYFSSPGLAPIVDLINASRRTLTVIRLNLAASIFYNAFAAALAITGTITPLVAAILMPISSLTVLTISFRANTFGRSPARSR